MTLFHTTKAENVDSILKTGLRTSGLGIVYLSEKPETWWQSAGMVTLAVNMDGITHRLTTFNDPKLDEILCWGDIPPEAISVHKCH